MTEPQGIQTVVLCGGKGTRLREYTEAIPKVLVEVGARPILWHIMKGYARGDSVPPDIPATTVRMFGVARRLAAARAVEEVSHGQRA